MAKPTLTKEQILFFLHKYRSLNPKLLEHRRRLIDSFVNAIYLYDDRMIITFNYKEGTKTITFADIEDAVNGSDMHSLGAPNSRNPNLLPIGEGFGFLFVFGDMGF